MKGILEVKKIPFKPTYEDKYFRPTLLGHSVGDEIIVKKDTWLDTLGDYTMYALGMCYRTKSECERNLDKDIAKLKAAYDND